ncbi:hypothetical protein PsYK624_166450 [Phanerochaete sordida]|uniref:Uncharacterized protein n=1 Tax=Phanerochaete sordida TaxID=48140 RepID=A0A9P3GSL3_9APHY|nr:hypothetical protein PsYK624_166450 [Phanerochaete sordida]
MLPATWHASASYFIRDAMPVLTNISRTTQVPSGPTHLPSSKPSLFTLNRPSHRYPTIVRWQGHQRPRPLQHGYKHFRAPPSHLQRTRAAAHPGGPLPARGRRLCRQLSAQGPRRAQNAQGAPQTLAREQLRPRRVGINILDPVSPSLRGNGQLPTWRYPFRSCYAPQTRTTYIFIPLPIRVHPLACCLCFVGAARSMYSSLESCKARAMIRRSGPAGPTRRTSIVCPALHTSALKSPPIYIRRSVEHD